MGFQFCDVHDKGDNVSSKSIFLDFEAQHSVVVFCYVYVFLLCKEFVEIFVGIWILVFCRWVKLFMLCVVNMVIIIIVSIDFKVHEMFDLSLTNVNMITSEHLMC
jgi:hypothetical protein